MKRLLLTTALILSGFGQANAAELKWMGIVNLRQSTIGCYDIQDTLNPGKAQRLADRAYQYLGNIHSSDFTDGKFAEMTQCRIFQP